jgi:hypothetical protein
MKYYAQFYKMSSGYVPKSSPPIFNDALSRPVQAVGSDSVFILDGRNHLRTMIADSLYRMTMLNKCRSILVGFKIMHAPYGRFTDEYQKVLYCYFPNHEIPID